jgi:hypothetical protein
MARWIGKGMSQSVGNHAGAAQELSPYADGHFGGDQSPGREPCKNAQEKKQIFARPALGLTTRVWGCK